MPKYSHLDSFPVEEYEFGKVSDKEIDACYYYEFAREQSELIKGIKLWRNRVPDLAEIKSDWLIELKKKQKDIFHIDPRIYPYIDNNKANDDMPKYLEKCPPYLLNFVVAFPQFPDTPWQSIPSYKRQIWAKYFKAPTQDDLREEPNRAIDDITVLIDTCEKEGTSLKSLLQRSQYPNGTIVTRLLNISWSFPNKLILAAFAGWLDKNRPYDHDKTKIGKKSDIDQLGAEWTQLPHEKRTSLDGLGVYRRKKLCNWREFLEKWPNGSERRYRTQKKIASKIIDSFFDS